MPFRPQKYRPWCVKDIMISILGEDVGVSVSYWNSTETFNNNSCSILREVESDYIWETRGCEERHPFICQKGIS